MLYNERFPAVSGSLTVINSIVFMTWADIPTALIFLSVRYSMGYSIKSEKLDPTPLAAGICIIYFFIYCVFVLFVVFVVFGGFGVFFSSSCLLFFPLSFIPSFIHSRMCWVAISLYLWADWLLDGSSEVIADGIAVPKHSVSTCVFYHPVGSA